MEIQAIINSVFSLFIMILVGVYGSKKKIITSEINKELTNILIQIALPFMILTSFMFTFDDSRKLELTRIETNNTKGFERNYKVYESENCSGYIHKPESLYRYDKEKYINKNKIKSA